MLALERFDPISFGCYCSRRTAVPSSFGDGCGAGLCSSSSLAASTERARSLKFPLHRGFVSGVITDSQRGNSRRCVVFTTRNPLGRNRRITMVVVMLRHSLSLSIPIKRASMSKRENNSRTLTELEISLCWWYRPPRHDTADVSPENRALVLVCIPPRVRFIRI